LHEYSRMGTLLVMDTERSSDHQLVFSLLAAASGIEKRLDRSLGAIKGITFREYQLLRALQLAHESTATRVDLARSVDLTPSVVTRALKPLEKLGYLNTSKDGRDARRSLATLTDAGRELVADASGVVADVIDGLPLSTLTPQPIGELVSVLQRLS
jgi:DNA-binding MarR family transcriptional regulator